MLKRCGILHYAGKQLLIGEAFFRQPAEKGLRHVPSFEIRRFLLSGPAGNTVKNAFQHWDTKWNAEKIISSGPNPTIGTGPTQVLLISSLVSRHPFSAMAEEPPLKNNHGEHGRINEKHKKSVFFVRFFPWRFFFQPFDSTSRKKGHNALCAAALHEGLRRAFKES